MAPPLDTWHALSLTARRIVVIGDSIPGWNFDGTTNYVERLRTSLTSYFGYGGHGFYGLNAGALLARSEWASAGTWTQSGTSPTRKSPWGYTYTANGVTNTQTFTKPSGATITSFDLLYEDRSGTADFSYKIDGGSATNTGGTFTGGNALRKVTINSSVTSTVQVRAANAAGTGVALHLVGIRLYNGSSGLIIDDCGYPGLAIANWVNSGCDVAAALLALYPPDLVIINSSNDYQYTNAANAASLNTLLATITTPTKLLIADPEQDTASRTADDQANWRELSKNKVKAAGGALLDMYPFWGLYATALANGLWVAANGVHPTDVGYQDIEARVLKLLTVPRAGGKLRS